VHEGAIDMAFKAREREHQAAIEATHEQHGTILRAQEREHAAAMARLLDAMRKQEKEHTTELVQVQSPLKAPQPPQPPVPPVQQQREPEKARLVEQPDVEPGQASHVFKLHKEHGRLGMQLGVLADLRVVMVTQVCVVLTSRRITSHMHALNPLPHCFHPPPTTPPLPSPPLRHLYPPPTTTPLRLSTASVRTRQVSGRVTCWPKLDPPSSLPMSPR
jgi:hypothetical protein